MNFSALAPSDFGITPKALEQFSEVISEKACCYEFLRSHGGRSSSGILAASQPNERLSGRSSFPSREQILSYPLRPTGNYFRESL
jgi:hypothetical protein